MADTYADTGYQKRTPEELKKIKEDRISEAYNRYQAEIKKILESEDDTRED